MFLCLVSHVRIIRRILVRQSEVSNLPYAVTRHNDSTRKNNAEQLNKRNLGFVERCCIVGMFEIKDGEGDHKVDEGCG